MFSGLFSGLLREAADLKVFLSAVVHFLTTQKEEADSLASIPARTLVTPPNSIDERKALSEELQLVVGSIEPTVVVADGTRAVRMVCPVVGMVATHSPELAHMLQVNTGVQFRCCF